MLGQRIRQARLMAGLSQDELASQLTSAGKDISKQAISKYENGDMMPKPTTIIKLAQVLHVDTTYLLETPSLHVDWLAFRAGSKLPVSTRERIKSYGECDAPMPKGRGF